MSKMNPKLAAYLKMREAAQPQATTPKETTEPVKAEPVAAQPAAPPPLPVKPIIPPAPPRPTAPQPFAADPGSKVAIGIGYAVQGIEYRQITEPTGRKAGPPVMFETLQVSGWMMVAPKEIQ